MRLNENTYPTYFQIQTKEGLADLKLAPCFDRVIKTTENYQDLIIGLCKVYWQVKHKYYITKPFKEAITKAYPKIQKDLKHLTYDKPDAGIYISESGFILYLMNPQHMELPGDQEPVKAVFYAFHKTRLNACIYITKNQTVHGITDMSDDDVDKWVNSMLATYYFINECETEQLIVQPGTKSKNKNSDPAHVYNESKEPVIVLDCKWFTEIIRNIPFMVNGHFRWQPFGEKHGKRKLIWIEEFKKEGYHRKPTKESV
jgi:hypothetical protein